MHPDSTIERIAIPWLHIVREHPIFLTHYTDLFKPDADTGVLGRRCRSVLRNIAGWYRQLFRAARAGGQLWFEPKELPQQVDVLFVSHLLNDSHAGKPIDFYYGNLPNELKPHGFTAAIALINYSKQPGASLVSRWNKSDVARVILSDSLGFGVEHSVHRRLKKESHRLRELAKKEAPGLYRRVLVRASQEALSSGSHMMLRIGMQLHALVSKLRPKVIVVTHEGHAWERVVFASVRNAAPGIRCFAYQHAAVFRMQHAIRRNLAHDYNPDQILTAGSVSKTQLEHAPGIEGIPISVLGSNRSFKGATNDTICTTDQQQAVQAGNTACLVLPEGLAGECHLLFEFSLACAHACPEVQFIWRLHPVVSFESLVAQNSKLRYLPKNIVLSQATFEEDIAKSRWALYRGTTAVFQTVVAGMRPIYLHLQGELEIDPLYELEVWRVKIQTVSEFRLFIQNDIRMRDWPFESDIEMARTYCQSYFLPMNVHALTALIPK